MPSKNTLFTPSSILFRPRHMSDVWHLVEAPGTAPGSERFIVTAVYRHSRSSRQPRYRRFAGALKGLRHKTHTIVMVAGIDSHTRLGNILGGGKRRATQNRNKPQLEGIVQISRDGDNYV